MALDSLLLDFNVLYFYSFHYLEALLDRGAYDYRMGRFITEF